MSKHKYLGYYYGMPEQTYYDIEAYSNSGGKELDKTPDHYQWFIKNGINETADMVKGKIVHLHALEPEKIKERIVINDENKNSNKFKAAKKIADEKNQLIVKTDDIEGIRQAIDNFKNHKFVKYLMDGAESEVSIFWVNEKGVYCKARLDIVNLNKGLLFDIKWTKVDLYTVRDPNLPIDPNKHIYPTPMEKHMYDSKWHWQMAHYLNGATKVFGQEFKYGGFVFIEGKPPHQIMVAVPDMGFLSLAEQETEPVMKKYIECKEKNEWPGIKQRVYDCAAPYYAYRDAE